MSEPPTKRTVAFIDGQNLFHAAKEAFGYTFPNYDVTQLAHAACRVKSWSLHNVCFYTGVPDKADKPFWNEFWQNRLRTMSRSGVRVFSRSLRYRNKKVKLPGGEVYTFLVGEEKGVDIRIALDIVRMARRGDFDVALVFSQDQDLSEVADEIRAIAKEKDRWIKMASAFPISPTSRNKRGINKTDWVPIDRQMYDACIDPRDYRPKK